MARNKEDRIERRVIFQSNPFTLSWVLEKTKNVPDEDYLEFDVLDECSSVISMYFRDGMFRYS